MIDMYHEQAEFPISVHPSQVNRMLAKGWTEKPIEAQPQPTDEVNEDGES
jgi:hypothetical protein